MGGANQLSLQSLDIYGPLNVLQRKRAMKGLSAYPVISCMGWQARRLDCTWDLGFMVGSLLLRSL